MAYCHAVASMLVSLTLPFRFFSLRECAGESLLSLCALHGHFAWPLAKDPTKGASDFPFTAPQLAGRRLRGCSVHFAWAIVSRS